MQRTIQTTYRYRLAPTAAQEQMFNRFACARRFVWNWALNRKREHFQQTGKMVGFSALCVELTRLKQQPATFWLREMHAQSLQQALRDVGRREWKTLFNLTRRAKERLSLYLALFCMELKQQISEHGRGDRGHAENARQKRCDAPVPKCTCSYYPSSHLSWSVVTITVQARGV